MLQEGHGIQLVEQFHSMNSPPKLVNKQLVVDKNFSWTEHERVGARLKELSSCISDSNWNKLLFGLTSEEYCITTQSGVHITNLTVGDCCELILRQYLVAGLVTDVDINSEEFIKAVGNYAKTKEFRASLYRSPAFSSRKEFYGWLLERKALTLREIQIEVCKSAQDAFEAHADNPIGSKKAPTGETPTPLNSDAKLEIGKAIEKQIEKLKKAKRFTQPKWRFEDTFDLLKPP